MIKRRPQYEWFIMRRCELTGCWDVDMNRCLKKLSIDEEDLDAMTSEPATCKLQLRKHSDRDFGPMHADVLVDGSGKMSFTNLHASDWLLAGFEIVAITRNAKPLPKKYRRQFERWI